ncbi:hypothetical protein [Calothrix sp. PCC 6303]|uniref:hypothetical protein n=1 Tax=Calothrix sp. PCC 6303 TaxID=1170562 RepID=UPI0002A01D0A|nr:hypothetical protein [Calothrix sp. PCC 6303]AFZ00256.1 hypothetical protein Cal6303_1195 [Calothrix sp. PCC 6303]
MLEYKENIKLSGIMNQYQVPAINVSRLRQLWNVVEQTQANLLLNLNDGDLVKQILQQISYRETLSNEETDKLSMYIHSRTSLIRDLVQEREA